jgi:type IX secretion system PorP/SprF family membrane protein
MPDISLYNDESNYLHMRWTIHSGILIDFVEGMRGDNIKNLSIAPNVVYVQQKNFHQLNAGMYVNLYPFVAGLWFRNNFEATDAVIVLLGFQQNQYKVGYSFDYTVSRLGIKSGGAHEISVAWLFNRNSGPAGIPKIHTPGF